MTHHVVRESCQNLVIKNIIVFLHICSIIYRFYCITIRFESKILHKITKF